MKRVLCLVLYLLPAVAHAQPATPARPTFREYQERTAKATYWVDTLADLQNIPASELALGRVYATRGRATSIDGGGMKFAWIDTGLAAAGGVSSPLPLRIAGPNGDDDYFRLIDEGRGLYSFAQLGQSSLSTFTLNPAVNSIGEGNDFSIISAPGQSGFPNRIGYAGKPVGTAYSPPGWTDDTGFVAGSADYATIFAGYDNVCNQIAGSINGMHSFIPYNSEGHSNILSGTYCVNGGARCVIGGGRAHSILGAGTATELSGIFCGELGVIESGAHHSFLGSGYGNNAAAAYAVIPGGFDNRADDNYSWAFGYGAETVGTYATHVAAQPLSTGGLCQIVDQVQRIKTNSTTTANLVPAIEFDDGKVSHGVATISLTAMRDASPDGENGGSYLYASWHTVVSVFYDGTNYQLFRTGIAEPSQSNLLDLPASFDDKIGIVTVPNISSSNGSFRVRVTGLADTDIEWVARISMVMQSID